jgi:hypothetical protein
MDAVNGLRPEQQVHKGECEEFFDFGARPIVANIQERAPGPRLRLM